MATTIWMQCASYYHVGRKYLCRYPFCIFVLESESLSGPGSTIKEFKILFKNKHHRELLSYMVIFKFEVVSQPGNASRVKSFSELTQQF